MNEVPMGDARRELAELGTPIRDAIERVLSSGRFILGEEVAAFEAAFAEYCGVQHCVAVASGTDALTLAVSALELPPESEVLVPALTSGATITAVLRAGARAAIVDVAEQTCCIDAELLAGRRTGDTAAVVPVHLYGTPVDIDSIRAAMPGIQVVEDACQAHGARVGKTRTGAMGAMGCFSFYPSKNLGSYGDGGAITTDDADLAARLRVLRQYGWRDRDDSSELGYNSRLDELQAAVLRVKLAYLDEWNLRRGRAVQRYRERLEGVPGLALQQEVVGAVHHLFVVRVHNRDAVRTRLSSSGIMTGVHYPIPIHRQAAFAKFARGESFPVAESACREILSLPLFPQIEEAEVDHVSAAIREAVTA